MPRKKDENLPTDDDLAEFIDWAGYLPAGTPESVLKVRYMASKELERRRNAGKAGGRPKSK